MAESVGAKTKATWSASIARVTSSGKRTSIRSGGKVVGIVPLADLKLLEEMDRQDVLTLKLAERRARKKGQKPIPWNRARATLGL